VRWVLSTVASAMIFDDHDVHDDWNTSDAWRAKVTGEGWWRERIAGAFMSYRIYEHVGNLSVADLRRDELFARVSAGGDAAPLLHEFALHADRDPAGSRWSFRRDLGTTRLVVIDSRAGRVLAPGARDMLDAQEWSWLDEQLTGDVDHLLIATSLPFLLGGGMHDLEAWNEAVCRGAWGPRAARWAERMRQALDLEHWAAFERSFRRLAGTSRTSAPGGEGERPARSSCSRATCTTPTSPRSPLPTKPRPTPRSCRPCARLSATPSTLASARARARGRRRSATVPLASDGWSLV